MASEYSLRRLLDENETLKNYKERAAEGAREMKEVVMQTAAVGGAAGLLGYINGRYGDATGTFKLFQKARLDVTVGVVAHAVAFSPYGRKYKDLLHNVGDGGLALAAGSFGLAQGQKARAAAPPKTSTQGTLSGYTTPYGGLPIGSVAQGLGQFTSQWAHG